MGNKLPGTQGLTLDDQDNIDDTVARGCAIEVYKRSACAEHTNASLKRRKELLSSLQ